MFAKKLIEMLYNTLYTQLATGVWCTLWFERPRQGKLKNKNIIQSVKCTRHLTDLRVIATKNQRNRGHGRKIDLLIICQSEGLGK